MKKENEEIIVRVRSWHSYKKEDVVLLQMRQLSTKDQNDTDINNYRSPYSLQQ